MGLRLVVPAVTAVAIVAFAVALAGAFGHGPVASVFPTTRSEVALGSRDGARAAHEARQIAGGKVQRVQRTGGGGLDVTVAVGTERLGVELTPRFELIRVNYGSD